MNLKKDTWPLANRPVRFSWRLMIGRPAFSDLRQVDDHCRPQARLVSIMRAREVMEQSRREG